jgi:hypothetical protein
MTDAGRRKETVTVADDSDHTRKEPATALEEVLREVEDAERRVEKPSAGEPDRRGRGTGEAGDAITPNTGAQEQAHEE